MIKTEKAITITIDGRHVEALSNLLNLAGIYLKDHKADIYAGGGLSIDERRGLSCVLSELQDACS